MNPWYQDFVAALGDGLEVPVCAPGRPFASQVQNAIAVVNVGPFFEPDMVPAAREAGVRLLLAEVDPGNVCAGGTEGYVGGKTFDQMAGDLKA